jgi:predicted PurR-regulated permease PerM
MNKIQFNERFRQILMLLLIVILAILLVGELKLFFPGILGGVTLYIITRTLYFKTVYKWKLNKKVSAFLFIFGCLLIIAIPVVFSIHLLAPKIHSFAQQKEKIVQGIQIIDNKLKATTGLALFNSNNAQTVADKITTIMPQLINSTATIISNLIMLFFIYYFMLVGGKSMELYLGKMIPLKDENIDILARETKSMVKANALGIPIICLVQGIFGAIGYLIFGVEEWGLWGFFTGVFAFFPLVGTMIIWVPLVIYLYASGNDGAATGVMLYSLFVTGNVDYVARLTLMKKMGNVHPLITVFGVIIGLNMFGFMGLIFGPLLVSYFIILLKIYINEFNLVSIRELDDN